MKTRALYILDQLTFSAFGFVLFLIVDMRFALVDVAQYSVMISGSAFLLNFGFAVMIERRLSADDKSLTLYDLIVLVVLTGLVSLLISVVLWHDYEYGVLLGIAMFSSSLLWLVRRICVLNESFISFSIAVTLFSSSVSLGTAYLITGFYHFLIIYSLICMASAASLSCLVVRRVGQGFLNSTYALFDSPAQLGRAILLVPLLWFPSNGIYLVLTYFGSSIVLVEVRKLLMLLSPVQQFSSAMINYIFSRGRRYKSSLAEVFLLPVAIALIVTPICAVVYTNFLKGAMADFGFELWLSFAMVIACMLIISIMQSLLRVKGKQAMVIVSLLIAVFVKVACLLLLNAFGGGIDLAGGFTSMAIAYSISALFLSVVFSFEYKKSEGARS